MQQAGQHCCGADCPAEAEVEEETQQVPCMLLVCSVLQHMLKEAWQALTVAAYAKSRMASKHF